MSLLNKLTSYRHFFSKQAICLYSSRMSDGPSSYSPKVVLNKDGQTVVCWHPERQFPYEYSLPLPEKPAVVADSVLKIQSTAALSAIRRPKSDELIRQELMNITHTTKHVWFPCTKRWRRKKTEMDRPYL